MIELFKSNVFFVDKNNFGTYCKHFDRKKLMSK